MSNLVDGIAFSLSFTDDFENRELAQKIVDVLLSAKKSVRPKKYGAFQPELKVGEMEDVVDVLVNAKGSKLGPRAGSLILEEGKNCGFQVQWNKSSQPSFSFIGGHLMFSAVSKNEGALNDFVSVIRNLVSALSPAYGEIRSMAVKGWDAPMNLFLRLPDIPPVSVYGKEYIAFFGREKIEKAPFLRFEMAGDCYWLISHELVMESVPDATRSVIRSYFGEEAFMANGKWKYAEGHAPEFDLSFSLCN